MKSAELDEIAGEDLLSEYSQVRWIITKAALIWDCPFASLLVMLDNTRSQRALTQLVGRVMRQPDARRTGREALDQCHVYCWQTGVDTAVRQVKLGLEAEGLTGLGDDVFAAAAGDMETRTARRRPAFRGRDIFLPKVLHRDGGGWRGPTTSATSCRASPGARSARPSRPRCRGWTAARRWRRSPSTLALARRRPCAGRRSRWTRRSRLSGSPASWRTLCPIRGRGRASPGS